MHKEDICSNFVSLHLFPNWKDLDVRLYIDEVDSIGRKQLDLLLDNLVVEKPLEKLWHEEAILKSLAFFLIPSPLLHSALKSGVLLG